MEKNRVELSEKLIKELYIDLRKKVNEWSKITNQTPQARMGYIGQHLVSIVTGYPGGKSGARGYDLIIDDRDKNNIISGEIKTCYRVDQLGKCNNCGNVISSLEKSCSFCESTNIKRNDDSKWLITMDCSNDIELTFEPKYYYFVLFEFEDINNPTNNNIIATIWKVETMCSGFLLCMLDYYYNIRGNAPFNLWPHMLKFNIMKPIKIYESIIYEDDSIKTIILDNGKQKEEVVGKLENYASSKNLDINVAQKICKYLKLKVPDTTNKKEILKYIDKEVLRLKIPNSNVSDVISYSLYYDRIKENISDMPDFIKRRLKEITDTII